MSPLKNNPTSGFVLDSVSVLRDSLPRVSGLRSPYTTHLPRLRPCPLTGVQSRVLYKVSDELSALLPLCMIFFGETMTSSSKTRLILDSNQELTITLLNETWMRFDYPNKEIRQDILPKEIWYTLLDETNLTSYKSHIRVHIMIKIKKDKQSKYLLNIKSVVPDPYLGVNSQKYLREFVCDLISNCKQMGVAIEFKPGLFHVKIDC